EMKIEEVREVGRNWDKDRKMAVVKLSSMEETREIMKKKSILRDIAERIEDDWTYVSRSTFSNVKQPRKYGKRSAVSSKENQRLSDYVTEARNLAAQLECAGDIGVSDDMLQTIIIEGLPSVKYSGFLRPVTAEVNAAEHKMDKLQLWHERLGHIGLTTMQKLVENNPTVDLSKEDLQKFKCEACIFGKIKRKMFKTREEKQYQGRWFTRMYVELFRQNHTMVPDITSYSRMMPVSIDVSIQFAVRLMY
ncbi:hypothetical protein ALC57_15645, partial [Trachymyrmex cornetzi]